MRIFELDTEDRLNNLINNANKVEQMNNSFADNASKYRRFTNSITLPFDVIRECCWSYERNVLIDAYTYAEQLLKNFYYHVLEKDTTSNVYFRAFINSKLDVDHFSPNANFSVMESGIRKDLISEFQFLLKKELPQISKYNDLVKSRHKYAHKGEYIFDFSTIKEVLDVECYITSVFGMIVEYGDGYRIEYQNRFREVFQKLKELSELYKHEEENPSCASLKENNKAKERELYSKIRRFYNDYYIFLSEISIVEELVEAVEDLLATNRTSHKKVKNQLVKIQDIMKSLINIKG